MGMFDSIQVKMYDHTLHVQTKLFDCILENYEWLDQFATEGPPETVRVFTEDWTEFNRELWFSFVLIGGIYVDHGVAQSAAEAQELSKKLQQLWSDPELHTTLFQSAYKIEQLKNKANCSGQRQLRQFFTDYDNFQKNKEFFEKDFNNQLSSMDKLCNSNLLSNRFVDRENKKYLSIKAALKAQLEQIKNVSLEPKAEEKIKSIIQHIPFYVSQVNSEIVAEGYDTWGGTSVADNFPIEVALRIYEEKEKLLQQLYIYSLKKIKSQPHKIEDFLWSRLFNTNPHPVFQSALQALDNLTLDYQHYYSNTETYLLQTGANKKAIDLSEPLLLANSAFLLGVPDFFKEWAQKHYSFSMARDFYQNFNIEKQNGHTQLKDDMEKYTLEYLLLMWNVCSEAEKLQNFYNNYTLSGIIVEKIQLLEQTHNALCSEAVRLLEGSPSTPIFHIDSQNHQEIVHKLQHIPLFHNLYIQQEQSVFHQKIKETEPISSTSKAKIKKI